MLCCVLRLIGKLCIGPMLRRQLLASRLIRQQKLDKRRGPLHRSCVRLLDPSRDQGFVGTDLLGDFTDSGPFRDPPHCHGPQLQGPVLTAIVADGNVNAPDRRLGEHRPVQHRHLLQFR